MDRIGELSIVGGLKSSCIHLRIPYRGWEQQIRNSENVVIPMSSVKVDNLARWIQEHGKKLKPKKGEFIVFWRKLHGRYEFGLAHDSRGIPKDYKESYKEDQLSEFPRQVKI